MSEDDIRRIAGEELKEAVKKAYQKGYYEGWKDACDNLTLAILDSVNEVAADMKESVEEAEVEAYDEEEK